MNSQILVADKQFEGKYVALESFTSRKVIAAGDNPTTVVESAQKKGVASPVLVFVPNKDLTHIY